MRFDRDGRKRDMHLIERRPMEAGENANVIIYFLNSETA